MQLKTKTPLSIRNALTTATCSLLGSTAAHAFGTDTPADVDIAVLIYSESDNRVQALEPVIGLRKELDDDEYLSFKIVIDSLTGATPTGATPSSQVQTFTRPSGNGDYTVQANDIPLDDTFLDTRVALSTQWEKPISKFTKRTYGLNLSKEYDFLSIAANAAVAHDFNQRNSTFNIGIAFESDKLDPEGGIPTELAPMLAAGQIQNRRDTSESRTQLDLIFGLTQVIDRRTIMQFNLSYSQSDGYHTDPFKLISIVDPVTGEPIATDPHIFENRPDSRTKTSIFWKIKHHFEKDIIDFSYRYLTDDWEITSHTFDLRYTWQSSNDSNSYWQPHIRYYIQDAAEFYRTNLTTRPITGTIVSADYRLADMTSITLGLKYGRTLESGNDFAVRIEYLSQTADPSTGSKIGNLSNKKIVPDTDAIILQTQYSF